MGRVKKFTKSEDKSGSSCHLPSHNLEASSPGENYFIGPASVDSRAIDRFTIVVGTPRDGINVDVAPVEAKGLRLHDIKYFSIEKSDPTDLLKLRAGNDKISSSKVAISLIKITDIEGILRL